MNLRLLLAIALLGFATADAQTAHYRTSAAGPAKLPDLHVTPGLVRTTDAKVVCAPGYAKTQRHTAGAVKKRVYALYGQRNSQNRPFEIDHVISLELGGADSLRNLFPQPYWEHPGAHEKDALENDLHAAVCAGKMKLTEAQRLIAGDWYAVYVQRGLAKRRGG